MTNNISQAEEPLSFSKRVFYGLATFATCFAYSVAWIWQGIDFTDEGYNLFNQWMIANDLPGYRYGMIWLSDLVGGMWLRGIGDYGLIYARLGGAINIGILGLASYWILSRYFRPCSVWIAVTAAIIMFFYRGITIIAYNTFPSLLLILASGAILISQEARQTLARRLGWSLLGGVLLALAVAARLPLILCVCLPAIPVGAAWLRRSVQRENLVHCAMMASTAWGAFLAASAALLGWLAHLGRLAEYWQQVTASPKASHSLRRLFSIYLADALTALEHALFLIVLGCVLALIVEIGLGRVARRVRWQFAVGTYLLLVLAAGAIFARLVGTPFILNYFALAMPGLFGLLATLLALDLLWSRKEPDALPLANLLLLALAVPVLLMAGSNNGLLNMRYSLPLLAAAVILLIARRLETLTLRWPVHVSGERSRHYWLAFAAAWVICGFSLRFDHVYRDLGNRLRLTVAPDHPRLRHVYTTAQRASSINGLLKEMNLRVRPGDRVLAYDSLPMLHYLTGTIPALEASWPAIMRSGELETALEKLRSGEQLPVVAVRAKVNMRDPAWGVVKETKPMLADADQTRARINQVLAELGYREVWQNGEFAVLVR